MTRQFLPRSSTQDEEGAVPLSPKSPTPVERRYLPATNILETTFLTDQGVVRVTDAMTLPVDSLGPFMELQRRIEGVSGVVPLRWSVEPRFGYGARRMRAGRRAGVPVFQSGPDAVAVCAFDAGEVDCQPLGAQGHLRTREGMHGVIGLSFAHQEPLVLAARPELDARFEKTCAVWRAWARGRSYSGPWGEAVLRSALALKLLVHAPSGAVAAAATTSLPEEIGGERNWDYRFSWIRDSGSRWMPLSAGLPGGGSRLLLVVDARVSADSSPPPRPLHVGGRGPCARA